MINFFYILFRNNYDLWAFFPGKLETKIQHGFNFYDLKSVSKDEANITTYNFSYSNDSIVFNENITYSNFSFTDKTNEVTFLANSIFSLNETSKNRDINEDPNLSINTISHGMIELIHTLTNPPNYQILINSLKIVSTNILDSDRFIRKLFTVFAHERIFQNKAMVKKTILSRFNDDLAELLYSGDNSYSIGSINGLYEWSLLIDNQDMVAKAEWLKNDFKLSSVDINNIIGNQSFLSRFYQYFINYLKFTFKCYDDKDCLNQLVYKQLFDGSVTKELNIDNIQDLYLKINSTYYPFLKTPEIKNYYEEDFKKKMRDSNVTRFENMTFENMGIDMDIVKSLISGDNTTLLKSENAIDFVFFNYTKNLYSSYLKFNIQTLDQLFFFSDYFGNFLPSIYLYPSFQVQKGNETSTYYGNKLSNALVSLIPIAVNQSIEKIKNNIVSVLISRITYHKLKSEENIIDCRCIFKNVTHNNLEKVEKICSNPQLNLENYKSIKRWVYISDCIYSYCKEEEKQQLKALSGLNNAELGELFRLSNLGRYINTATQIMRNNYDIGYDIYEKASNQFFFSSITLNVPQFMLEIKSTTLHDFDDDVFPNPLEIKNYLNYNGDYNDIKRMLTRIFNNQIKGGEKIYNQESAFAQKINLIITFTKYFVKIDNTASDYIKMIKNTLFNKIDQSYSKNNLVFGSSDPYIDILKKGDFYENFKPNKSKFTGIPLNLNFDGQNKNNNNNEKVRLLQEFKKGKKTDIKGQFDRINEYSIFTGRFSINNLNLRTISKINNEKIFNFKKAIYTNEGKEIYYRVPILKGKSLIESSDGFQYSAEKNVIYYYDKFSSNVLSFEFKSTNKFSNINCDFYQLANTIETPLTEKDIGKSNILKNLKSIKVFFYFFFFRYYW